MSLVKCIDCQQEISDRALTCVKCGRLTDYGLGRQDVLNSVGEKTAGSDKKADASSTMWSIITQLRAPINVFAFAMMAAAAVFGMYSVDVASETDLKAFAFALHMFLAIAGMFFVTLLFCPGRIYHPNDLNGYKFEQDRPDIAVTIIVLMLVLYAVYEAWRLGGFVYK